MSHSFCVVRKFPTLAFTLFLALPAVAGDYESAMEAYRDGRTGDAVAGFEAYVTGDPGAATAACTLFGIGVIHEHEGDTAAAIDAYRRVIDSRPASAAAREAARRIPLLCRSMGDWGHVVESCLDRMLLLEQYHPAWFNLRDSLEIIDMLREAGVRFDPDAPEDKWLQVPVNAEWFPRTADALAFARGPDPVEATGNLLRNPGFERDGRYVPNEAPVGWRFIPAHGPYAKDQDGVLDAGFLSGYGASCSGNLCVGKYTNWGTARGWYLQRVRTLPGEKYDCSVYAMTGPAGAEEGKVRVGVDPAGGTDPEAESVVWTDSISTGGDYVRIGWSGKSPVTAKGDRMTLFLELRQNTPADHNVMLFDDAAVVPAGAPEPEPQPAAEPPAPLPTPTPLPPVPDSEYTRMGYDPALLPGGLLLVGEPSHEKIEKHPEKFDEWRDETLPDICRKFRGCGMMSARVGLVWYNIEHEKGVYDWRIADEIVFALQEHGIVQVACVATSPPWALDPGAVAALRRQGVREGLIGCTQIAPEHWDDYERYLERLVLRYRDCIDHWEIWNEPDGMAGHKLIRNASGEVTSVEFGGDPDWMTELLRRSERVIRALDPYGIICVGGFEDKHPPKAELLEGVYDRGGRKYFDAVGIHTYGTPLHREWFCFLRQVLVDHGDAMKPFWVTEYGLRAEKDVKQAYRLRRSVRALREIPYVVIANGHIANMLWNGTGGLGYRANQEMAEERGPRAAFHQDFEAGAADLLAHWEWDTRAEPKNESWLDAGVERAIPEQGDYYLTGHSDGILIRHELDTYVKPENQNPVLSFLVIADSEDRDLTAALEVTVEPSDVCKPPETVLLYPEGLPVGKWIRVTVPLWEHFPGFRDDTLMAVSIAGRAAARPEQWEFAVDDVRIE